MMHGPRCRMQDSRYMMYYLTPIEILFIRVVSCTLVFYFFFNQKSAFQNQKYEDPVSCILHPVSFTCFVLRISNLKRTQPNFPSDAIYVYHTQGAS